MISPKLIVECPGLSAKKRFKKENPSKMEGSTQYRGGESFQNRGLVSLYQLCVTFLIHKNETFYKLFFA